MAPRKAREASAVALAAHGVLLRGDGQQFGLQEAGQPGVGHARGGSAGVEPGLHVPGQRAFRGLGVGGQLREEAVLRGVLGGLLDHDLHLPGGGHFAVLLGGAQRLDVAVQRGGDVVRASRDVLPLRRRCPSASGRRSRGSPAAGRRCCSARPRSQPDSWISSCRPRRSRMASRVTASTSSAGSRPVQRGEGLARGGGELLVPGGGEVLVFGLVPGQAELGGEARVEPDQGVREGIGDGVDGGLRARRAAVFSVGSVVTRKRLAGPRPL